MTLLNRKIDPRWTNRSLNSRESHKTFEMFPYNYIPNYPVKLGKKNIDIIHSFCSISKLQNMGFNELQKVIVKLPRDSYGNGENDAGDASSADIDNNNEKNRELKIVS